MLLRIRRAGRALGFLTGLRRKKRKKKIKDAKRKKKIQSFKISKKGKWRDMQLKLSISYSLEIFHIILYKPRG